MSKGSAFTKVTLTFGYNASRSTVMILALTSMFLERFWLILNLEH